MEGKHVILNRNRDVSVYIKIIRFGIQLNDGSHIKIKGKTFSDIIKTLETVEMKFLKKE